MHRGFDRWRWRLHPSCVAPCRLCAVMDKGVLQSSCRTVQNILTILTASHASLPVSSVLTQPSVGALEKLRRAMRRAPDGRFPPRIDHALPMSGMILSTRGRDGRLRSSPVRPSFPLIRHDIDPFSYCILPLTLSNIVPLTIAVHISNPTTALPTTHLRIGQRCQILRPGSSE